MRLPPLPSIRDVIKLYKLQAMRQLAQNFLMDPRLTTKVVKCAGKLDGKEVCEVGPGPGSLTRPILKRQPDKLVVIEKDRRFVPTLQMLADAASCPVEIIIGDVLTYDMGNAFSEDKKRDWTDQTPDIEIIGNLPFNVSLPLLLKWLKAISEKKSAWAYGRVPMTLMFQKEVAERMEAPVMSSQRSRLSVMCQNWCKVEHKFIISGRAFLPKPSVDVSAVRLIPLERPIIPLPFTFVNVVTTNLFNNKNKMIKKGVQRLFPNSDDGEKAAKELLERAEVDHQLRAIQLTVPEIGRICQEYLLMAEGNPELNRYMKKNAVPRDVKSSEHYWIERERDEEGKFKKWWSEQNENFSPLPM